MFFIKTAFAPMASVRLVGFLTGLFLLGGLAQAQVPGVPAELLDQVRNRQLGNGAQSTPSPLDQAREDAAGRDQMGRRSGQQQDFLRPFSPLEMAYQDRANQEDLREAYFKYREYRELLSLGLLEPGQARRTLERVERRQLLEQFGYDLFDQRGDQQSAVVGRVPDSYVLGVGDEFVVTFSGNTERVIRTRIDSEGRLILSELPPIPAAGRTFGAVLRLLENEVANRLIGTQVYASLGALKQITVYVAGEADRPGVYTVSGLSDVLDVLAIAGGVRKSGSLRRIMVVDGDGSTRELDLYQVLSGRGVNGLTLSDGARVVVPAIGPTLAVAGDVVRPGIYELMPGDAPLLSQAIGLAGGPLRPRGNEFFVDRFLESGQRSYLDLKDGSQPILAGDLVEVRPARTRPASRVTLTGAVVREGDYSLEPGMSLQDLLRDGSALKNSAYLPFAILRRVDPATLVETLTPINVQLAIKDERPFLLQEDDELIVLGTEEVDFLDTLDLRQAILSPQSLSETKCDALQFIAEQAINADQERFATLTRSVFVTDSALAGNSAQTGGQQRSAAVLSTADVSDRSELARLSAEERQQRLERDKKACPDLFNDIPEVLALAIEHSATINGAVRKPGLYPVSGEIPLQYLVNLSGGLTRSANTTEVEIIRYTRTGEATAAQRDYFDLEANKADAIQIDPGATVRFFSRRSDQEPGTVLLSGEFMRPGVYTIRRGEMLSELIERAVGLTREAYPLGAVFTRVSVKEEQRRGLQRTARELNNALALAALSGRAEADAIVAAETLTSQLQAVEAQGRVVVEADPTILEVDPTLDILLEAGDTVTMPKKPNFILTVGDLLNPGALQYDPEQDIKGYIGQAGGMQATADKSRVFVVYPNGVAEPVLLSSWSYSKLEVPPGTTIVVPKDVNPLKTLDLVRDVAQIVGQLALSAASLAVVFDGN